MSARPSPDQTAAAAAPPEPAAAAAAAEGVGAVAMDEDLLAAYDAAERKFNVLVHDLKLTFLEVKLYQKYFINAKTPERLALLNEVIAMMAESRLQTLRLLKLIQEREEVVAAVFRKSMDFSAGRLTTLEAQTQVLQLLYAHQQVTLRIVEGVVAWRELLTHPYPFKWKGLNYLTKIATDCTDIDASSLRTVLPLRVVHFPLCSNITSISLFAGGGGGGGGGGVGEGASSAAAGGGGGSKKPRRPSGAEQRHSQQATSPAMTKRLRAAEALVLDEPDVQARLARHLHSIASTGCFVPLLNLQQFIPNCASGIHVSKPEWGEQYKGAMERALHEAEREGEGEGDGVGGKGPQAQRETQSTSREKDESAEREGSASRCSSSSSSSQSRRSRSESSDSRRPTPQGSDHDEEAPPPQQEQEEQEEQQEGTGSRSPTP